MKKTILLAITLGLCLAALSAQTPGKKPAAAADSSKERAAIEAERADLQRQWADLKSFQLELEQRALSLEKDKKNLEEREKGFKQRLEAESVNKSIIESYESIDPEQAAPLIISLFKEDETLTVLLMRKMTPKKAGKIMEAMILLDRDISTRLAQQVLSFYSKPVK